MTHVLVDDRTEQASAKARTKWHHGHDNGRMMEPLILDCSGIFDPEDCIDKDWKIPEEDTRLVRLPEIDFSVVLYELCTMGGARPVTGWIRRRKFLRDAEVVPLGVAHFWALWQDWERRGTKSVLERLRKRERDPIHHLDFLGTILADPDGRLCIPNLWYELEHRRGRKYKSWNKAYVYINELPWDKRFRSAVLPLGYLS